MTATGIETGTDTIVAAATPPGKGGIGVIRISGSLAPAICTAVAGSLPAPRTAVYRRFRDAEGRVIDEGLVLYFTAPASFTGEHVVEFQGHGGPVVMNMLLERCLALGARMARPGEFSERAFLNDRMDLSQVEAVADLIDASSRMAARSAVRSLQGEFSALVNSLTEQVTGLRIRVEAGIDFPEEEIDIPDEESIAASLEDILATFDHITVKATQGALLREGASMVLAGRPNAGKSSLMNQLTGKDSSIVTHLPGTTRDIVDDVIELDGVPLRLVDTAGIRETRDEIEREGVKRALAELQEADFRILIVDGEAEKGRLPAAVEALRVEAGKALPEIVVINKVDLNPDWRREMSGSNWLGICAMTGQGLDELRERMKEVIGFSPPEDGVFMARTRHLDALERARTCVLDGRRRLLEDRAGELLAEELRLCQDALGEITGKVSSDDLLGRIFSSFCIGK